MRLLTDTIIIMQKKSNLFNAHVPSCEPVPLMVSYSYEEGVLCWESLVPPQPLCLGICCSFEKKFLSCKLFIAMIRKHEVR